MATVSPISSVCCHIREMPLSWLFGSSCVLSPSLILIWILLAPPPKEVSSQTIMGFDPLPPLDAIASYTRPQR